MQKGYSVLTQFFKRASKVDLPRLKTTRKPLLNMWMQKVVFDTWANWVSFELETSGKNTQLKINFESEFKVLLLLWKRQDT